MTEASIKQRTIVTYDKSAQEHGIKFDQIGARVHDVELAFTYLSRLNPRVVELGCGNGRDAVIITNRTNDYLGIDLSEEMINLAQEKVPGANFQVADLETFQFPEGTDIIFAFASLLHSDRDSVKRVLENANQALNPGGVFFISLKLGEYHQRIMDREGYGPKTFYFYTPEEIKALAPEELKSVYQETERFNKQDWFNIILQKR